MWSDETTGDQPLKGSVHQEPLIPRRLPFMSIRNGFRLFAVVPIYCVENPEQANADRCALDPAQKMFMKLA